MYARSALMAGTFLLGLQTCGGGGGTPTPSPSPPVLKPAFVSVDLYDCGDPTLGCHPTKDVPAFTLTEVQLPGCRQIVPSTYGLYLFTIVDEHSNAGGRGIAIDQPGPLSQDTVMVNPPHEMPDSDSGPWSAKHAGYAFALGIKHADGKVEFIRAPEEGYLKCRYVRLIGHRP